MSYMTVVGMGRLGKDAELRFTKNGAPMLSFTIATDEMLQELNVDYTNKRTETAWIDCIYFGSEAEALIEKLVKGALVTVSGKLTPNSWTDAEGQKRTKLQVKVESIGVRAPKVKEKLVGTSKDHWESKPVEDVSNVPF